MKTSIISSIFTVPASLVTWLIGDVDIPLKILFTLILLDLATGFTKGWYNKRLSSKVMSRGIIKKAFEFLIIILSVQLDILTGNDGMFKLLACYFYIATEGISIIENVGEFLEYPEFIKKYLEKLKAESEENK